MSNDLISRRAVVEIIQKEIDRTSSCAEHDTQINILYGVEALPTAYDVDKVVEKLEEEGKKSVLVTFKVAFKMAVEIVKAGIGKTDEDNS